MLSNNNQHGILDLNLGNEHGVIGCISTRERNRDSLYFFTIYSSFYYKNLEMQEIQ